MPKDCAENIKKNKVSMIKKITTTSNPFLLWALLTLPTASHAKDLVEIVNKGISFLQGPLARAVGILSIIGLGYATLVMHKVSKEMFLTIALGIGIILGAPTIYSTFFE